ncbi:MAG TPA: hypothetical protein VIO61_05215 [Anaerolineaceae bacterium]
MDNESLLNLAPMIGAEQIALLERLSNACGISGDEGEVRTIILEQVKPTVDEVRVDALGNVLAVRKARKETRLRLMVAAHMDEIGLILVEEEEGGLYRFEKIGGIDNRTLVGKMVLVGKDHLPGVIGARPIHLQEEGDDERAIPIDSLKIDLGPGGKAKVGDRVAFATRFQNLGVSLMGKALDNRLGVAALIELLKHPLEYADLCAAFTVQEELGGARGARVAAHAFNPNAAFALDCTPANDLPSWDGSENVTYNTRLDAGAAVYVADRGTLSDPRLVQHVLDTASAAGIFCQVRQPGGGSTDAASIHRVRAGIPSLSISTPGRYLHTPVSIVRLADWQSTLALVYLSLQRLTPDVLGQPR